MKGAMTLTGGLFALIAFSAAPALYLGAPASPKGTAGFVLQFKPGTNAESLDRAVRSVGKRLDYLGVEKPVITAEPPDRLRVQFPPMDRARLKTCREALQRPANLEFRMVHPESDILAARMQVDPEMKLDPNYEALVYRARIGGKEVKTKMIVARKVDIAGQHVKDTRAGPQFDPQGLWSITIEFDHDGTKEFSRVTSEMAKLENAHPRFAIVLDKVVISAAGLSEEARRAGGIRGDSCTITGNFDEKEACDIANALLSPLESLVGIEEFNPATPAKESGDNAKPIPR
jgi:SecD/SecF fusion protein